MNAALADYGRALVSRWRWVMWGALLALAATTALLLLRPPLYRSQATVFVRTPGDISQVVDGGDFYARARAQTYAALASSTSLSSRVVADLGLDLKPEKLSQRVDAWNPPGTALIDIAVSAPSPAEAQRSATVLLAEYATTVRNLESVPGLLVPRAELVVVDPPGSAARAVVLQSSKPTAVSIPVVLVCAALLGSIIGSFAAVLRSVTEPPAPDLVSAPTTATAADPFIDGTATRS